MLQSWGRGSGQFLVISTGTSCLCRSPPVKSGDWVLASIPNMRGLYEMILRKGEFVAAVLIFTTCGVMAFGQGNGNGQGNDNQGDQGQDFPGIIKHRPNPHGAGSVTTGSIGPVTPLITNHGGPVIGTPNIYFIWYGNWNQSDGSDTPA